VRLSHLSRQLRTGGRPADSSGRPSRSGEARERSAPNGRQKLASFLASLESDAGCEEDTRKATWRVMRAGGRVRCAVERQIEGPTGQRAVMHERETPERPVPTVYGMFALRRWSGRGSAWPSKCRRRLAGQFSLGLRGRRPRAHA